MCISQGKKDHVQTRLNEYLVPLQYAFALHTCEGVYFSVFATFYAPIPNFQKP